MPNTTALRAAINYFLLPARIVFRYVDVIAQKNRCRRRIHRLNESNIPGGNIISAVAASPSTNSCIVTFNRAFATNWNPSTSHWRLIADANRVNSPAIHATRNSNTSIYLDIDGVWEEFGGPWTVVPLSANAVEFNDGGNLTSINPFIIENTIG